MLEVLQKYIMFSGGSRISCCVGAGANQLGAPKTYAKIKELGPAGGGARTGGPPLDPPMMFLFISQDLLL